MKLYSGRCFQVALLVCGAILSFGNGCSKPDRWYDSELLYRERLENHPAESLPAEILPRLSISDQPVLPDASVDEPVQLSLEQAVFLCLGRNRELQVQRYRPLVVGTFEQIERGVYDPELFSEAEYSEEVSEEVSRSTEERFSVTGDDVDVLAGVRQKLPTGTEIETSVGYAQSSSNRTPDQSQARAGVSITQALLRGAGPVVNLIDVRSAELDTQASMYEYRGIVEALVAEVETAYWYYVLARESITIFERSLEVARRQLYEVENRIEVGIIPKNSAAAARAEVARREQALIEARSVQRERRLRLLRLLNASTAAHYQLDIEPASQPRVATYPVDDLEERIALGLRQRPEIGEATLRRQQQKLEVIRTRNGLLPKLEVFMDIGKTGYADSFNDSWSSLDEDNYELNTGLRLSSYLDNRSARGRYLAARASLEQAEKAIDNLLSLVELDIRLAANEVDRTRQQIQASGVTTSLEQQSLKAEQDRFSVGEVTSLLVAQAQRDLLVSQLAEIESIVDYRIALVALYLAEGSLLERRGVQLDMSALSAEYLLPK